jgi:hypothetical protein
MIKRIISIIDQSLCNFENAVIMIAESSANHWCEENGINCKSPSEAIIIHKRYKEKILSGEINSIIEFRRFIYNENIVLDTKPPSITAQNVQMVPGLFKSVKRNVKRPLSIEQLISGCLDDKIIDRGNKK